MYNVSNLEPKFRDQLIAEKISPITLKNYLSDLRHFFGWLNSKSKIDINNENNISDITYKTIDEYKNNYTALSLPNSTINRRLSALRKFFAFCHLSGFINSNPIDNINNVSTSIKSNTNHLQQDFTNIIQTQEDRQYEKIHIRKSLKYIRNKLIIYKRIIIIIVASVIILALFRKFTPFSNFLLNNKSSTTLSEKRFISYKGILKDKLGQPISHKTDIIFRLYNAETNGKVLYTANCVGENNSVTPDVQGNFTILIGSDCGGSGIPNSTFLENSNLYLGISIGSDTEMTPRLSIANVGSATNSQNLQGLPLGNSISSVPFIDQNGNLLITAESPILKSSSGIFSLEAQALELTTSKGSSGNIKIAPDQGGNTFITSGNFGIGTTLPSAKLDVQGDASISGNLTLDTFGSQINQLNGGNLTFQTSTDGDSNLIPRLTLLNNGNLGIGTMFPSRKLEVVGGAKFYDSSPILGSTTVTVRAGASQASNALFEWQNSSGSTLGLIDANGYLGVGTTNIKWKLQANDYQPNGATMMIENTAPNNTSGHAGLLVKLGDNSTLNTNNNDQFIEFLRGDSTVVGKIKGNGSNGVVYSTTGSDFAEYFTKNNNENFSEGDIVSINQDTGAITKASTPYDNKIIGAVSANPGFTGGVDGPDKILVGLVGQLELNVTSKNGPIYPGDLLTSSNIPGVAMKATKPGLVVAKAITAYINNDLSKTGKIKAYVNINWYDPNIDLTQNGDIILTKMNVYDGNLDKQNYALQTNTGQFLNNTEVAAQGLFAQLKSGYLEADNAIITNTLSIKNAVIQILSAATANIENLSSNVINVREKITSPVVETNEIQSEGQSLTINLNQNNRQPDYRNVVESQPNQSESSNSGALAKLIIKGLENKTVAAVDSLGNASFSGSLVANKVNTNQLAITSNLEAKDASFSGILTAKEIQSDNLNNLQKTVTGTQADISNLTDQNQKLTNNINDVQNLLSQIKNQPLPDTSALINLNSTKNLSLSSDLIKKIIDQPKDQLTVTGNANLYNLNVGNSTVIGNILVENNTILSLAWDLKLSALANIKLFDDTVIIAKNGDITTKGILEAQGGIKTNSIEPIAENDNVHISRLAVNNLSIDNKFLEASNSASIIATADNFNQNGQYAPSIQTKYASAGIGVIPENSTDVIIYNQNVKPDSLIYLTTTSSIPSGNLTVIKKEPCNNNNANVNNQQNLDTNCKPYFKIALDKQSNFPVNFNWLIVN